MRTTFLFVFSYLLLLSVTPVAVGGNTQRGVVRPHGKSSPVDVVVKGKAREYYMLSSKSPATLLVRGPGELHVVTRAKFTPKGKASADYTVWYVVDGGERQEIACDDVRRSRDATFKDGTLGVPGGSRDFTITLGRGDHTIALTASADGPQVCARFLFAPTRAKKRRWVAMSPLSPMEPVDLIAGESSVHYYRFTCDKPMKLEVNGPTELRVLTRVENNYDMKGRANYRIQVKQDGNVLNTYMLSSIRSETTVYKDDPKHVPGKAREIGIEVPKGRHVYEIVPMDPDKCTLLGQVLFPQKDVSLAK